MGKKSYDVSDGRKGSKRETDGLTVIPESSRTYGATTASSTE